MWKWNSNLHPMPKNVFFSTRHCVTVSHVPLMGVSSIKQLHLEIVLPHAPAPLKWLNMRPATNVLHEAANHEQLSKLWKIWVSWYARGNRRYHINWKLINKIIIIIIIIIIVKKGQQCKVERVVHTQSVRRLQPHNTTYRQKEEKVKNSWRL